MYRIRICIYLYIDSKDIFKSPQCGHIFLEGLRPPQMMFPPPQRVTHPVHMVIGGKRAAPNEKPGERGRAP